MNATMTIALAGNPNSGKTTMFNGLTGSRQHVGNYPGITVEKKEGFVEFEGNDIHIIDLPGAYSLTAYSQEELVARRVLVENRPHAVVDVVNAGALERNLYLTVQIMELGIPVVIALNMMDEVRKTGLSIDSRRLSTLIDAPVVETVARSGEGKQNILREALAFAGTGDDRKPLIISYGPDLDPVLEEMTRLIQAERFRTDRYPARWLALKYLEADEEVLSMFRKTGELGDTLAAMAAKVADHCRKTQSVTPEAIIADYRYGYIASLLKNGVIVRDTLRERIDLSDRIDRILTHALLGPAIMLLVFYGLYTVTFALGKVPMTWLQDGFALLGKAVEASMPDNMLRSLLVSGAIAGVGGVMGFVPLIMLMFFMIAFLEDSGYMARMAYMLDRVIRAFGLHGCSVMPFIVSGGIAGGCAVPGIMATRTLRSPMEKLATILTAPLLTCGAKLPVFILVVAAFFPKHSATVLFGITLLGWVSALLVARLLRSTIIRGKSTPFVMELPPYRMPTLRGMFIHTWERTWQYMRKAGTVILAVSVLLWAAMTFPGLPDDKAEEFTGRKAEIQAQIDAAKAAPAETPVIEGAAEPDTAGLEEQLKTVENEEKQAQLMASVAGRFGTLLEPVSLLAGFDWRTNIALVGGFAAKEVIVSTLGTAYSLGEVDTKDAAPLSEKIATDPAWSVTTAAAFIIFVLLYAPCMPTVVMIAREASWGWAAFSVTFNTALAFGLAVAAHQLGRLLI